MIRSDNILQSYATHNMVKVASLAQRIVEVVKDEPDLLRLAGTVCALCYLNFRSVKSLKASNEEDVAISLAEDLDDFVKEYLYNSSKKALK